MNESLVFFMRLLWTPGLIKPEQPFNQGLTKLRVGGIIGPVGLCIEMFWLLPRAAIMVWLPGIAGVGVILGSSLGFGFGVSRLVSRFEQICLKFAGFRYTGRAIYGSQVVWFPLPLVAMPIHLLFPFGITTSGHPEIVFMLLIFFTCGHLGWLYLLLWSGHCNLQGGSSMLHQKMSKIMIIMATIEIGGLLMLFFLGLSLFYSFFPNALGLWLL